LLGKQHPVERYCAGNVGEGCQGPAHYDLAVIVIGAGSAGVVEAEYSALDAPLATTEANELLGAA